MALYSRVISKANAPGDKCALGKIMLTTIAKMPPRAALDMNMGASNPPEVPEPSEMTSARALKTATRIKSFSARLLFRISEIVS